MCQIALSKKKTGEIKKKKIICFFFTVVTVGTVVTAVTVVTVVKKIPQPLNKKIMEPLNNFFLLSHHFLKEHFETLDFLLERLQDFLLWRDCMIFLWRGCMIFCC